MANKPLQVALEMNSTVVSGDVEMVASSDEAPLLPLLPLPLLRLCNDADLTN